MLLLSTLGRQEQTVCNDMQLQLHYMSVCDLILT